MIHCGLFRECNIDCLSRSASSHARLPIRGLNGPNLADVWSEYPITFLGNVTNREVKVNEPERNLIVSLQNSHTLAIISGPGTPAVNGYSTAQMCSTFLRNMVDRMIARNYRTFMPTEEAQRD